MPVKNLYSAYENVAKATLEGRELEAHVLNRAAQLLIECQAQWHQAGHTDRLDQALGFNQKLWTFFQIELANPEHPLPKKIRENLLSLSLFIDKTIFSIMSNPSPEQLTPIININRNIANGLQGIAAGS